MIQPDRSGSSKGRQLGGKGRDSVWGSPRLAPIWASAIQLSLLASLFAFASWYINPEKLLFWKHRVRRSTIKQIRVRAIALFGLFGISPMTNWALFAPSTASGSTAIVKQVSNVTGRHRGQKRKLRSGYRAQSRHRRAMCRQSYFCLLDVSGLCNVMLFIVECGIARFLCAMRVFDVRPLSSPLVANFVSVAPSIAELARGE